MPSAAPPSFWSRMRKASPAAASALCGCPMAGMTPMPYSLLDALKRPWGFARRELRGGIHGFRIFFLCLLLGTAAIAAVESLSDAFLSGLRDQGQTPLGGDVAVELVHQPATTQERAFL